MYFQKLESLYNNNSYKGKNIILDAFDEWLAFVPRTYRDRLSPDMFQINQGTNIIDSLNLFNDAVEVGVLSYKYMLVCSCGYVMNFYDNEIEAIQALNDFYDNEESCLACEQHNYLTTDNILVLYKLLEQPQGISYKKKTFTFQEKEERSILTLSNVIEKNLPEFTKSIGEQNLTRVAGPSIRKSLLALKGDV